MKYAEPPLPHTLRIADGRQVGYYEYGDPDGVPVFALHGSPGSAAGFMWADDAARAAGVRLIAPDRPGIGLSDAQRRNGPVVVADYGTDLAATADAFDVDDLRVIGYSGGGPYAVAAAWAAAERMRAVAVVSGSGEVGRWASTRDFELTDRGITRLSLRAPIAARALLSLSARGAHLAAGITYRITALGMHAADREVMQRFESSRAALAVYTRAFLRGAGGVTDDYAALGRPWGFDVEEVRAPLACFHARADPIVPLRHSVELAARVPGATLTEWPTGGHLAIVDHIAEVIAWVLRTETRPGVNPPTPSDDAGAH